MNYACIDFASRNKSQRKILGFEWTRMQVEPDLWRVENVELLIGVFDTRKTFFIPGEAKNALTRKYERPEVTIVRAHSLSSN
jgi:hypothetical protein